MSALSVVSEALPQSCESPSKVSDSTQLLMSLPQANRINLLRKLSKTQALSLMEDIQQAMAINQNEDIVAVVAMIREKDLPLETIIARYEAA
ncbi:hypothetical protein P0F32_003348 [Vibrio metschnikovii]|nr:hypothetical protein [Vibrio metschnikovii]MCG3728110.1 hypothetical protein [Vibrio cincinnatiensis]